MSRRSSLAIWIPLAISVLTCSFSRCSSSKPTESDSFKFGASEWQQLSPLLGSDDLHGIAALRDAIWVVGDRGVILKSDDNGRSWCTRESSSIANLADIVFLDARVGIIVGRQGTILKSEDQGLQWRAIESPTTSDLTGIYKTHDGVLWVVGAHGCLLKSEDRGLTWKVIAVPTNANLFAVTFVNERIGWIAGANSGSLQPSAFLRTSDGGVTWQFGPSVETYPDGTISLTLTSIGFFDTKRAIASGYYRIDFPYGFTSGASCFLTADSGKTWKFANDFSTTGIWKTAISPTGAAFGISAQGICVSKDGGMTWKLIPGAPNNLSSGDIEFNQEGLGVTVANGGIILTTEDGGGNWLPRNDSHLLLFSDVQFFDRSHGIAIGTGGVYLTADGGISWNNNAVISEPAYSMSFWNESEGHVIGRSGTIYSTHDQGHTWSTSPNSLLSYPYYAYFLNQSKGWVVAYNGTFATTDGLTWTKVFDPAWQSHSGIAFSDSLHGWFVRPFEDFHHTVDGGATWQSQHNPLGRQFCTSIACLDSERAWVAGYPGLVLHTVDGGQTWVQQATPTGDMLTDIEFADSLFGRAIGSTGTLLVTEDGGQNWHHESSPTSQRLEAISVVDSGFAYAIGWYGTALRFAYPKVQHPSFHKSMPRVSIP